MELSKQAKNSLQLYKGGNPSTIEQLLKLQASSVVNELKQFLNAEDLDELVYKLSNYSD